MPSSTKKDSSINRRADERHSAAWDQGEQRAGQASPAAGRETRPHIGIFGRCNVGKSTLLNFIVETDTAIVSPESGTTTDVVRKSYEILNFAPVVFLDTAGIDDQGSPLGAERVRRTLEAINQVDLALLVFRVWGEEEEQLAARFRAAALPFVPVYNPTVGEDEEIAGQGGANVGQPITEGAVADDESRRMALSEGVIRVDPLQGDAAQRDALLAAIRRLLPESSYRTPSMFEGRVEAGETVLLVCPIDSEAPAGRMILPQVQAIRELLDRHAVPVVVQPEEIGRVFALGLVPCLVVTDSQLFPEVRAAVPPAIEVTSFSILLAAAKGDYPLYLAGLERVDSLQEGDRILIAESCTHQVSCDDIGRVKIPRWLEAYTGRKFRFTVVSGLAPLPEDLDEFALMVQCGGCMVTRSQLRNRIRQAAAAGVAVTNYGMLIRKIR